MPERKKVLFLLPYPIGCAPSQRFRIEAFFPLLKQNNIYFTTHSFYSSSAWNVLYQKGSIIQKVLSVFKGFIKTWAVVLFEAWKYDFIFIHRESSPVGPPVFEWILSHVFRKRLIYDFDDAIWVPNTSKENKRVGWFKAFWKVKRICAWSYKVVGGNKYLCDYARIYNNNVIKIPTCVDTNERHNLKKKHHNNKPIIGWTGSHSTLVYLEEIVEVLQKLQQDFEFSFLVISNKSPELSLKDWQFIQWKEETEITDLLRIDIGIMPLKNDSWSEGKCGFKLIQYLSLGLPAVASHVGVNKYIIEEGSSGFLCNTQSEWIAALKKLLCDASLRQQMGAIGREKIVAEYSLQSQSEIFLDLFS